MSGPFTGYAPPGVYTETRLDPAVAGLLGTIRVPALMGTAEETKVLDGYDMVRGSSATRDNQKVNEDVSSQFITPGTRSFTVQNYPIVIGNGLGTITNNTNDVVAKVNGEPVIVASVVGLSGTITLAISPNPSDNVTVTYYYKKTDTKVVDENLSTQVDGTAKTFYTHYGPIVDGTNAGKTTTDVNRITVKVNSSIADVASLNGTNGAFTLVTAPTLGQTLTVTYYFNMYANTADDLPQPGLIRVIRVGISPETSDFVENIDFAIIDNQIQWGTGFKIIVNTHTTGAEFFDDTQITPQVVDNRIYNEDVSAQFIVAGVTQFTVAHAPIVDGAGRDTVTEDPSTVSVTVNGLPADIRRLDGETGIVVLVTPAPALATVLISYWWNRMQEDTYRFEVVTAGAVGVGTYTVTSEGGATAVPLGNGVPGTYTVASGSFTGPVFTDGISVAKGHTVAETISLTFTSNTAFTVTSTDVVNGSSGTGVTGSTYIDARTGIVFTLASDILYAAADVVRINVTYPALFVTSVVPILSIPGMTVKVDNTTNTGTGDLTDLVTFDKSGKEPNVGDIYYISYEYVKTDFDCKLFSKFKDILNEYGDLSASNPLALAAYLSFTNGAVFLILCQAKKALNSDAASDQAYLDILERLKQPVSGVNTQLIVPLTTSQSVIQAINSHVTQQSSKRYRRERISFFGFATGTEPADAGDFAQSINNERMTAVYPDGAVVQLVQPDGSVTNNVVDGSFLAAAYAGLNVSPAYDVAEPMTRKQIVGITQLVRTLDEVNMDLVASRGITVIMDTGSFVIRHALTTNMASSLTREQNIITIRDFIQQEARRVLDPYIGRKFTSTITGDVATTLGAMLRAAVEAVIIVDFKGVTAERDAVEPDFIRAAAYYLPIIGVNYIEVVFNIRVRF